MSFRHDTTTESRGSSLRTYDAGPEGFEFEFDYESERFEALDDDGERIDALDEEDESGLLDDEDEDEEDDEEDEDEEDAFFRMGEDDGLDFDEEDS